MLKHDRHLEHLIQEINLKTSTFQKNLKLFSNKSRKKRLVAEIDLLVERKHSIEVYEVKCSYRINKAQKQLKRIKRLLEPHFDKPIKLFFYNGGGKELVPIGV